MPAQETQAGFAFNGPPAQPEAWLRGPVPDIPPALQPVAHALLQALEDAERLAGGLGTEELWTRPGGAASVGFHLRHAAGSLDRLLTYARGEALSDAQREALGVEMESAPDTTAAELLDQLRVVIGRGLAQLRGTPADGLDDHRPVGRAGYPSSVRGLLHHAGEHTARHIGQVSTTVIVVRGVRGIDAGVAPGSTSPDD
jgi:hypothetical protein